MENKPKPDYGPRDIEDDYFQEIGIGALSAYT